MPSAEKLAANRSNAHPSTGPKTEAGKKAASRTATRHGLTGKHIVIQGENPEAYEALRRSPPCYRLQLRPHPARQNARYMTAIERAATQTNTSDSPQPNPAHLPQIGIRIHPFSSEPNDPAAG